MSNIKAPFDFLTLNSYGIKSTGWVIPSIDKLIESLGASWQYLDPAISITPGSPQHDILENQSFMMMKLYSLGQQVFDVWNVGNVSSIYYPVYVRSWLSTLGMTPNQATYGTVSQRFIGTAGTPIPIGTQVRSPATGNIYETVEAGVVDTLTGASTYYATVACQTITINSILDAPNSITNLLSPVVGIISTTNPDYNNPGYAQPTPQQEWQRVQTGLRGSAFSAGYEDALLKALNLVDGLIDATVFYNGSNAPVAGIPANQYAVVVSGGDTQEIINAIGRASAAPLWGTFGSISGVYITSRGFQNPIKFSRPITVNFSINIGISVINPPAGLNNSLPDMIQEFFNTFGIGVQCSVESLRTFINNIYLQYVPQNQIRNIIITSIPPVVENYFPITWQQKYGTITSVVAYV